MLYKEVPMEYLPLTRLTLGNTEVYYYGERNNLFDEVIVSGDIKSDKFVVYYCREGIVCGFLTFGYKNLHLYMIEAMRMLIMPMAVEINSMDDPQKSIVNMVMNHSASISCVREQMLKVPSVFMAVKGMDVERAKMMRKKISSEMDKKEKANKEKMRKQEEDQKKQLEEIE
mmetsp:Transcript_22472/g.25857  ORF Transcript_22472/g.25857 Transcript_22472/m.25857 type:complete len:171 (-) Transcript_22472:14-526(-)